MIAYTDGMTTTSKFKNYDPQYLPMTAQRKDKNKTNLHVKNDAREKIWCKAPENHLLM
jgi:hypothetical protein